MTLAKFIGSASDEIIAEWAEFARTCVPAASELDLAARRDHVKGMLEAITLDLETPQTTLEQSDKSKGRDDEHVASHTAANAHGSERAAIGFTPAQMISEFRALRATVIRLWAESGRGVNRTDLEEVTRFNEAIDQALAVSISKYAEDVEHSKDLFLGVLGHDLRNPLGAIMMSATLMMTQEGPDWPHAKTASRILKSGARMDGIIRDLLDFTRTRLGSGIPIVRAPMDLEVVCRQTVDEIAAYHPRTRVNFEASGDLHGEWDSGRIAQALSNLVGNAHQHGLQGSPIDVSVRGNAAEVVIAVHNLGPVIPKKQLREMFDPFRQLEPKGGQSKDPRSAGLGLYIAEAIVTAHQGKLLVASSGKGTTFTMHLPRAPEARTTATATEPEA